MKTRNYISKFKVTKVTIAIVAFLITAVTGTAQTIDANTTSINLPKSISSTSSSTLKIYPNPADDFVIISFYSNTSSKAEIMIYDIKGSLLLDEPFIVNAGSNYQKFHTSKYPEGTYIIVIKTATATFQEKLLIKH